jgi:iron(III) transport system permease protein
MKAFTLPLIVLFFALFLIYPMAVLLGQSFFVGGKFSLEYFSIILENPFYRECFWNSFLIGAWSTAICLLICIPLAYVFLRFKFPGKALFNTLILVPLILPPFVGAIGLKQVLSRFGSLNLVLAELGLVDLANPPDWFGAGGFVGIIFLEVIHFFPILFLSVQAALANVDPSLRDAAANLGARPLHIFRTITVPLAMPGIFAGSSIVFVASFTDLGAPLIFDFQRTVPTQIFNMINEPDNPVGYALVVLTLVIVSVLFVLGKRLGEGNYAMMGRSASYDSTITLKGWAGWLLTAAISLLLFVSCLPHLGVIVTSFAEKWFLSVLPQKYSAEFYREVFTLDLTTISMRNSLFYATCSAALDAVLGVLIAYLLVREKFYGKTLLDILAMMPLALPGLVIAFAYYVAFIRAPFNEGLLAVFNPKNNPTLILIIAYAIHRLPYIVRAAYAGLQQTSVSLEEASANLGARPLRTIFQITLPLIAANIIAGTIMTFSFAMLDVSSGMVLAQERDFFPFTKAIFELMSRITPTAPAVACAMGVLAMIFLALCLWGASKLLGQKMGQLFKA